MKQNVRAKGFFKDKEKVYGIVCPHCNTPSPIIGRREDLPESFESKCPKCQQIGLHLKSQIRVLVAHRKQ